MHPAWNRALDILRTEIDEGDFETLFGKLRPIDENDRTVLLEAPDPSTVESINQRYLKAAEEALSRVSGRAMHLVLQSPKATQQELFPIAPQPQDDQRLLRQRKATGLVERHTFDNFIIGSGNQFAHAACRAVANLPGETYNPLFLYGGAGLGKTHLVNAVGNAVLKRHPSTRILYITSESFMNELITAIRRDRMGDFKARFRKIDLLVIDDVQFLAGRERTQEEFFHTFNSLYEARKQIILTSDKFPKEIPELEERLRNRFEWGLIADIQPPDIETRVAILQRKAEEESIDLPHDVALFLAGRVDSNVRELESSLARVSAHASLNGRELSLEHAQEVLQDINAQPRQPITIEAIQKVVCRYFQIRASDLRSKKRTRTIAVPRQVAMYLCRRYTDASFPSIGDRFGGRDHSTVIHAAQVVDQRLKQDPALRSAVERISHLLETGGETTEKVGEKL